MAFHLLGSYENNLPSITINQVFFFIKKLHSSTKSYLLMAVKSIGKCINAPIFC